MDIIEQIGAYGGLAAVLGLAVLSALYFSQARDVKRLREWAGRAPERVAEGAAADQLARGVAAQPQPKVVREAGAAAPGAKPATPAAKPVPAAAAAAAAAGAGPATANQKPGAPTPATPAAAPAKSDVETAAKEADKEPEKVGAAAATPAGAAAAAGASTGGAPTGQAARAAPAKPGGDGAPPAPGAPAAQPPTPPPPSAPPARPGGPPRPGAPSGPGRRPTIPLPSQRGAPSPSQTAILPPRPEEAPWYRRLLASPRYLVLAIAGVLIVGGAAAFGVVQLTNDDEGGTSAGELAPGAPSADGGDEGGQPPAAPINPADVTVSVLNGTTVPGLAASIADRVEANGFVAGNIDNSPDQGARNESVVLFAPGAEREAVAVARRLGISQREPIDAESRAIAGDASVVVVAGPDLTQ
jgi:LytR cell envelope-related transcriptional attenuator